MPGLLDRLRGAPQPRAESIYEHIARHLDPSGRGLLPGGERLPDEADEGDGGVRWAPGAKDGVASHHMGHQDDPELVAELVTLIRAAATASDGRADASLEARLGTAQLVGVVDAVLDGVLGGGMAARDVVRLGRRLASGSRHREAVKLGIALLGLIEGSADRDVLVVLGRHEEFTLYCAVALAATQPDADDVLWDLARCVDGWGRIHLVERLAARDRQDIRDWILIEGFRNTVSDAYLAPLAAEACGLAERLEADDPDAVLLRAATDLVVAIGDPFGPTGGLRAYEEAPRAIELLLGHLERRPADLRDLLAVEAIAATLDDDAWGDEAAIDTVTSAADADEGAVAGWDPATRDRLRAACGRIVGRPEWAAMVEADLASDDRAAFDLAQRAGRVIGIDTLEALLSRAERDTDAADWWAIMAAVDPPRIDRVLALTERRLDLDGLATGPALDLGLGPRFGATHGVEVIVQGLERFPGRGWPVLASALRSPVIRHRNLALNTLERWGRDAWPIEARPALVAAAAIEPDPRVRERLAALGDRR